MFDYFVIAGAIGIVFTFMCRLKASEEKLSFQRKLSMLLQGKTLRNRDYRIRLDINSHKFVLRHENESNIGSFVLLSYTEAKLAIRQLDLE